MRLVIIEEGKSGERKKILCQIPWNDITGFVKIQHENCRDFSRFGIILETKNSKKYILRSFFGSNSKISNACKEINQIFAKAFMGEVFVKRRFNYYWKLRFMETYPQNDDEPCCC